MITYETRHVLPVLNADADVLSVSFQQWAINENGDVAEGVWDKKFEPPHKGNIAAICDAIIEEQGVNAFLDAVLARKQAPVAQRDPLAPKPMVPLTEAQERAFYIKEVDDSIALVIADKTRFSMGYVEREKAATEYLASNCVIAPSAWITRFADNVGMTYKTAAELIIAQARQYRQALFELDNLRMDKYLISKAATIGEARNVYTRICFDRNRIAENLS
jgi:hypothetical protein